MLRPGSRVRAPLTLAVVTGVVAVCCIAFAPATTGGDVRYALIRGNSMESAFNNGDVALVRREAAYGVGDVIAYRDPRLGVVLHRVVALEGDRIATRGDNRSEADSYQPSTDDVLGRAIARWPGGLRFILAVTSVPGLALLAAAASSAVLATQPLRQTAPWRRRAARARRRAHQVPA